MSSAMNKNHYIPFNPQEKNLDCKKKQSFCPIFCWIHHKICSLIFAFTMIVALDVKVFPQYSHAGHIGTYPLFIHFLPSSLPTVYPAFLSFSIRVKIKVHRHHRVVVSAHKVHTWYFVFVLNHAQRSCFVHFGSCSISNQHRVISFYSCSGRQIWTCVDWREAQVWLKIIDASSTTKLDNIFWSSSF